MDLKTIQSIIREDLYRRIDNWGLAPADVAADKRAIDRKLENLSIQRKNSECYAFWGGFEGEVVKTSHGWEPTY